MLVFRKILILSYFLFAPVIGFEMMGFIARYRRGLFSFFATPTAFRAMTIRRFQNISKPFRFIKCSLFFHRFAEKNVRSLSIDFGRQGILRCRGRLPYLREYIKCIAWRTFDLQIGATAIIAHRKYEERDGRAHRVGRTIKKRGPNNLEKKMREDSVR